MLPLSPPLTIPGSSASVRLGGSGNFSLMVRSPVIESGIKVRRCTTGVAGTSRREAARAPWRRAVARTIRRDSIWHISGPAGIEQRNRTQIDRVNWLDCSRMRAHLGNAMLDRTGCRGRCERFRDRFWLLLVIGSCCVVFGCTRWSVRNRTRKYYVIQSAASGVEELPPCLCSKLSP